jgi:hypothetical protein
MMNVIFKLWETLLTPPNHFLMARKKLGMVDLILLMMLVVRSRHIPMDFQVCLDVALVSLTVYSVVPKLL